MVEETAYVTRGQGASPLVGEQRLRGVGPGEDHCSQDQPGGQGLHGRFGERDHPFFVTLPDDGDPAPIQVDRPSGEPAELADPQAAAIEQLDNGRITGGANLVVPFASR